MGCGIITEQLKTVGKWARRGSDQLRAFPIFDGVILPQKTLVVKYDRGFFWLVPLNKLSLFPGSLVC